MKKILLAGIAVLALAGTASAEEKWEGNFRQCHIRKWFSPDQLKEMDWQRESGQTIIIGKDEIKDLEEAIKLVKQCTAFFKCTDDREKGKVKHCYYNDKRWPVLHD
jgi:hypothetical protein